MRRLCMVLHGPYPVGEARVFRQARAAHAAGWEVDVVSMRRPGEPARATVHGADVHRLPLAHARAVSLLRVLWEYVGFTFGATVKVARLDRRRKYDVIQVNNPPDFLIVAGLIPRLSGARLLFDVHDLAPDLFEMRFGSRRGTSVALRLLQRLERVAARVAHEVVTVHEPYRQELGRRGVPLDKIRVVMNSLDEGLVPEAASESGGFRVVYHGAMTPHYGTELVVDAVARVAPEIPDLRLEIYGDGDALPLVERRLAETGLASRTTLSRRYLPQWEVLGLIQGASVGVVPNYAIPRNALVLPAKLMEYVALGIPIVSSDLETIHAHFSDDEILYFRPGDADSLADALLRVARDPDAASARARAALARYSEYTWEANARRYLEILDSAPRRRRGRVGS